MLVILKEMNGVRKNHLSLIIFCLHHKSYNNCKKLLWVLLTIVLRAMVKETNSSMFSLVSTTF